MEPSTRTPEGEPNRCPICGNELIIEPSRPPGDAPCPHCGHLLWFDDHESEIDLVLSDEGILHRDLSEVMAQPQLTTEDFLYVVLKKTEKDINHAIDLLGYAVAHKPKIVEFRRVLRKLEYSKYSKFKEAGNSYSPLLVEIFQCIEEAKKKSDWDAMDKYAEDGFKTDPWSIELHLALAEACRHRDLWDVEFFTLDCAADIAPGNRAVQKAMIDLMFRAK
jgi:hypothetical protein